MNVALANDVSFLPTPARIAAIAAECDDTRTFTLELAGGAAWPAPAPGQFVMLSIAGEGEAAFTVSSHAPAGEAIQRLCLTVRRVGRLTGALFRLEPGDRVGLRGPFGHGFPDWPDAARVLLVAGGCGLAPLRPAIEARLARRAPGATLTIVYGARDPASRILRADLARWQALPDVTLLERVEHPDASWCGDVGTVVGATACALVAARPDAVALCGPPRMLSAVVHRLRVAGIRDDVVSIAIERQMKCAVGLCGRCWIGHRYACTDGPVFSLAELVHLDPARFCAPPPVPGGAR